MRGHANAFSCIAVSAGGTLARSGPRAGIVGWRCHDPPRRTDRRETANDLAVRRALEAAGVEFIDNGSGLGVRLRKVMKQARKRKMI